MKELGAGTADFLRDMKPHALHRSSAKELILKDADYSTPQDHYFNYLGQKKTMYDQGMGIDDLNKEKLELER